MPVFIKQLSHAGGYLGDYMMTEYRSRAFQPIKCNFVKNWVYSTLYEEMVDANRLGTAASQLLYDMNTNWGQSPKGGLKNSHERVGDIFEITIVRMMYQNEWKSLYRLIECASLHELASLSQQSEETKGRQQSMMDALSTASDLIMEVRRSTLTAARVSPQVPLEEGIRDTIVSESHRAPL